MKLDYSKTINEQLEIFEYYKNNYLSYQLEIKRLNKELDTSIEICNNRQKEIVRLNNIINELEEEISRHIALCTDVTLNDILDIHHKNRHDLLDILKGNDKE